MINIGDRISKAVTTFFESISQNGKPNTQNLEFTVLAAMVAYNSESNEINIISMATGTKCAGKGDIGTSGCILRDCHAEVVARRAFIRFLLKCVHSYIKNSSEQQENSFVILEASLDPAYLLQIKSKWQVWLYVSDSPCGDASIYSRHFGRSFSGMKAPSVTSSVFNSSHESATVTKPTFNFNDNDHTINQCQSIPNKSSDKSMVLPVPQLEGQLGDVRLKPGRQDMKIELRSESMSCSDKIARWLVLGLQGGLLSNIIAPILLQGIVIGKDLLALPEAQHDAAKRAFHNRLSQNTPCHQRNQTDNYNNSNSGSNNNSNVPDFNSQQSTESRSLLKLPVGNDIHLEDAFKSTTSSNCIDNTSNYSSSSNSDLFHIINHHNSPMSTQSNVSNNTVTNITNNNLEDVRNSLPVIIISQEAFYSGKCSVEYRSLLSYGIVDVTATSTTSSNSSRKRKRKPIDSKFPVGMSDENKCRDKEKDKVQEMIVLPLLTNKLRKNDYDCNDSATENMSEENEEFHSKKRILLLFPSSSSSSSFANTNITTTTTMLENVGDVLTAATANATANQCTVTTLSTRYDNSNDSNNNNNNNNSNILDDSDSLVFNDSSSPAVAVAAAVPKLANESSLNGNEIMDTTTTTISPPIHYNPYPKYLSDHALSSTFPLLPLRPCQLEETESCGCITISPLVKPPVPCGYSMNWVRDVNDDEAITTTGNVATTSHRLTQSTTTTIISTTTTDTIESSLKHIKSCAFDKGLRGTVEVLSSRNGLRQGAGRPKNGDFSRICSRLCKRETALLMIRILRSKDAQKFPLLVSILKKIDDHYSICEVSPITTSDTNPTSDPPSLTLLLLPHKLAVSYHQLKLVCDTYRQKRNAFLSKSPFHRWNVADPHCAEGFTISF